MLLIGVPVNLGDYNPGDTIYFMWNSGAAAGASITRGTNGTISVYKDDNVTQVTTGVTDGEDHDTTTGLHFVTIVTSDGFYASGSTFHVVLTGAVVDTQTVNVVLARFTLGKGTNVTRWLGTAAATPTTAGVPEVDVTHWNGTAVATPDTAGYPKVTIKDGTGTGEIDTTSGGVFVAAIANNAITAASIATGAIDADAIADNAIDAGAIASDAITAAKIATDAITAAKIADGAIDAATFAAGAITATVIATGAVDADALATDAVTEITAGIWNALRASYTTAGSMAESFMGIINGSITSGPTATSFVDSSLSGSVDNQNYVGRAVVFITGDLVGQMKTITGYNATTKTLSFDLATSVPAVTDRYVIV